MNEKLDEWFKALLLVGIIVSVSAGCVTSQKAFLQKDQDLPIEPSTEHAEGATMPELIGGLQGMAKKLRYPYQAWQNGIEGVVTVTFTINEGGEVTNAAVDRGIGGGCDEEALRVVLESKFRPALSSSGEPMKMIITLPITFKIPESKN